jgi:hypothetical protein
MKSEDGLQFSTGRAEEEAEAATIDKPFEK